MKGNWNYGPYGLAMYNDLDYFLRNASAINQDGQTAFNTALYMYMTPQGVSPSVHEMVTGLWKPN